MPGQKKHNRISFFLIFLMIMTVHLFLTFVVILLLLSSLNILNRNVIHLERTDSLEKVLVVIISMVSAAVFLKSSPKISLSIKKTFFRDKAE